jgi:hypothetical protein
VRVRRRDVLLDAGPIVAVLSKADQWHAACTAAMPELLDRCVTTEAVVTEACHLVARGGGGGHVVLEFLLDADVPVIPVERADLVQTASLMRAYADVPMDFADATLVHIAMMLGTDLVFTTDQRGFLTYRTTSGHSFRLFPSR